MSSKENTYNSNSYELEDKLKLSKSIDSSNIIEWFKNLELYLKSKVDIYSKIIELRKVPDEWLCQYFPTEEEEASANSSKIKLKLLSQKMDDQASLVSG